MELSKLTALSPVDGRYRAKIEPLAAFFSEYALIRYRVRVEVEYFIALCELPLPQLRLFPHALFEPLRNIYRLFTYADAQRVKDIEGVTNHDVKAVEYFIKEKLDQLFADLPSAGAPSADSPVAGAPSADSPVAGAPSADSPSAGAPSADSPSAGAPSADVPYVATLSQLKEFIHFGLTSQDINNTSVPLSLKEALAEVYIPLLQQLIEQLNDLAEQWRAVPMLARTHGQPASPTRLGKELQVYVYRLEEQLRTLQDCPITAKFGGATGNFNAHHVAYPDIDWREFANYFVEERLGLEREQFTTQISNYDHLAAVFDAMRRIHTVLIDLDRDIWMYISMDYFKQRIKEGEVGSSAMPHKVNPIDFENSEGNLGMANAILSFLAQKLPVSRLQRDLTDSTVLRNIGVPMGHALIAFHSTMKGLSKLILNEERLQADLDRQWAVVAEAIQTVLRREGYPNPYETLKQLTRTNQQVTAQTIADFIESLNVKPEVKEELKHLSPATYTGL